mmetsp:Transcript_17281/g.37843  ORF Transcript_17281/g.37843 Transcript_17281/m.37843 type:complete len:273 (+) Transcript_17281:2505-3323(+)
MLEHTWSNTILRVRRPFRLQFPLWDCVSSTCKSTCQFACLDQELVWCRRGRNPIEKSMMGNIAIRLGPVPIGCFWQCKQYLHCAITITRVPQVDESLQAWSSHGYKFGTTFRNCIKCIIRIQFHLELGRRLFGLLQTHHFDPPCSEQFPHVWNLHRTIFVFCVTVAVGRYHRAFRANSSQFHHQWVLLPSFFKVIQCSITATTAVPILASPANETIAQVQPQILRVPTFLTFPRFGIRRNFHPVVYKRQFIAVFADRNLLIVLPRDQILLNG